MDATMEPLQGAGGVWYLFDDGTVGSTGPSPFATTTLSDAPAVLGSQALRVTATGFTGWGSGFGVDLRDGKKPFDASRFTGIRFWARTGAGKNTKHRVQISDAMTDVVGMKCNPAPAAPNGEKCEDHFGIDQTFTAAWTLYEIAFSSLTQLGWGLEAPAIDASQVYGLQITAKSKLEVELWIDQLEFY
jgi:hypothetical protein